MDSSYTITSPTLSIWHRNAPKIDDSHLHVSDSEGEDAKEVVYVKTRHWLWYFGHIYITITAFTSILTFVLFRMNRFWPRMLYKSVFSAVTVTYGISMWQSLGGSRPTFYAMLPLETFQFMLLSALWIVTTPHVAKLVPFLLLSTLHTSEFSDLKMKTTTTTTHHDFSAKHPHLSKAHDKVHEKVHERMEKLSDVLAPKIMKACAYMDIIMMVQLVIDCLLIRRGAVISMLTYGFFYRLRIMYSPATAAAFEEMFNITDRELSKPDRPPKVRAIWIRLRNRMQSDRLRTSQLHNDDTDDAIASKNAMIELSK